MFWCILLFFLSFFVAPKKTRALHASTFTNMRSVALFAVQNTGEREASQQRLTRFSSNDIDAAKNFNDIFFSLI